MIFSKTFLPYCFFLVLSVCTLSSCKDSGSGDTQEAAQGNVTDESQRTLEPDVFAKAIKKSDAVVIDVRMPQEFEQGHIENAVNINFFDPEFKYKLLDLDRNKKYYLYCKNETRSYRAMKFMEDNGFKNVYLLKGGYEAWEKTKPG